MLKSIIINEFQCHRSIQIDLDPHVTILVGDNGTGKSAIIRSLLWAALNKWGGKADGFIHWDAENARVELIFDNGSVVRQKGKDGNLFLLNGERMEGDLSRSIPVPYKALVNLTEDNFHEQLDPAFWFSLTAGQVAKSLNKIVNLCSIDDSLASIASKLRATKDEHKVVYSRLAAAQEIKKSLDWTVEAGEDLSELEAKQQSAEEIRSSLLRLTRRVSEANAQLVIRNGARNVILGGRKAIAKIDKLHKLGKQIKDLDVQLSRIDEAEAALARLRDRLSISRPRLQEAQAQQCPLCGRE